jgi:TonB family protein
VTPRRTPEKPSLVPVEILSKPNPVYTDAARKRGLQGEIVLSVVFTASGKLQVVRVVEGLGYGLNEAACRAAEAIRFKPALRDGQPVDFPATLRVVFQLAGSSTRSGEPS